VEIRLLGTLEVVDDSGRPVFTKAITYIYLADLSEAPVDYRAAVDDLERAHAIGVEITATRQLQRGQLDAASESASRALALRRQAGSAAGCARALVVLGRVAESQLGECISRSPQSTHIPPLPSFGIIFREDLTASAPKADQRPVPRAG
jgi:hypothetical protein